MVGVDRYLVVNAIAMLDVQFVIVQVDIQMQQDQTCPLISFQTTQIISSPPSFDYRAFDFDLGFIGH